MDGFKTYYFMKNPEWYTNDEQTGIAVLTDKAPEDAKKSYEEFLKDQEHEFDLRNGFIDDDDDEDEESEIATKLFGV